MNPPAETDQDAAHRAATKQPPAVPGRLARWRSRALRGAASMVLGDTLVLRAPVRDGLRRIALTFDDGPDDMTPRYLEMLERLTVPATFFLLGYHCERRPEAVRAIVAAGHEVASHGYSHRAFPTLTPRELVEELIRTSDFLPPSPTARPYVRPPKGHATPASLLRVAAAGYTTLLWSVDSDDCRTKDPREVEARLAPKNLASGDIVLMHEGQGWTLAALPAIVSRLRDQGFGFATVGELLG